MSNTKVGILIASGLVTGLTMTAVIQTARVRGRKRSLLGRTRRQALILKQQVSKLGESVGELIDTGRREINRKKKYLVRALDAGRATYQRVAR
jgi:hypothetical protein